jgi:transcriptional regulator with XRE-family HTH domain
MKNFNKKKQFVQLRAKGYSMKKIADELNVTIRTLYNWYNEFKFEIRLLSTIERETLLESLNFNESGRLKNLFNDLHEIETALKGKDLSGQPPYELMKWKYVIISQINKLLPLESNPELPDNKMNQNVSISH